LIRAVFDANVIVSGFPVIGGLPGVLLDRWRRDEFGLVLSDYILDEIARAWTDPYWSRRINPVEAEDALRFLRRFAEIVPVTVDVSGIASHAEDDMVIATAVSAEAEYLVTGDKELQGVRRHRGVRILSPREFLAILDNQPDEPGVPTPAPQP
jgi:putative PIN family toxin of toxin-antitoxin system